MMVTKHENSRYHSNGAEGNNRGSCSEIALYLASTGLPIPAAALGVTVGRIVVRHAILSLDDGRIACQCTYST